MVRVMASIDLAYGNRFLTYFYNDDRFSVLSLENGDRSPLSDAEIGNALDAPDAGQELEQLIDADDSVLIVVSDATRATGSARIVNLLVRRLIQYGVEPSSVAVIFSTGIHRKVSDEEKDRLLTPFITQRVRCIDHDAADSECLVSLGTTRRGTEVKLNKSLVEFSKIILTGGITFHYFAGFTGGRKSICPGLASTNTIRATHMLALDFETGGRRTGVGTGILDGNLVHQECEDVAAFVEPAFGINTIVNDKSEVLQIFCGDWRVAHRMACDSYLETHSLEISEKRDVVIASCGGSPFDINLIQAHKALEMASYACSDGGHIILVAECREGLGRNDFLKWFNLGDSRSLEQHLRESYEVNGQTAWSLLTKSERFQVSLVSSLDGEAVRRMNMLPASSLDEAISRAPQKSMGYILTQGASCLPRLATSGSGTLSHEN